MSEEKPVIRNTTNSSRKRAAAAAPRPGAAKSGKAPAEPARRVSGKAAAKIAPATKGGSAPVYSAAEVRALFERFRSANPEPKGELDHVNAFTLLIAVVLSAQATDAGVNKATKELFRLADTPEKLVALGEDRVRELIKTIGLFRMKAKNVVALARMLIERFGGEVPATREDLVTLPGVGRKTANVVLNGAFGASTIAVDTHLFRLGNRLGLAPGKTPEEVEAGLEAVIPDDLKRHAHHWLILHGRYVCKARRPECERCVIADLCKFDGKSADVPFPLPANP
ncbi:MAG: endonuclease III [Ancalomicrobiaceae bacterium]|nr:endonuclease III [Ancalomicrobiaceae bacterium]